MTNDRHPRPKLVIFDLDGVIYRGEAGVPGAPELVAALRRTGCMLRFATNNSMATRQEYVTRLAAHGIAIEMSDIATSTSATVDHLRAHLPEVRHVLALGAAGLLAELRTAGYETTHAPDGAPADWRGGPLERTYDVVIAGLDPEVDYRRIGIAMAAIRAGARFVATNADLRYPTPDGFVPGAGAIVAAVAAASGVEPLVVGKPQPTMFTTMLERAGVAAEDALVIGDNPDADIVAARRAGIPSMLVLTGVVDRDAAGDLSGDRRADWVAADPAAAGDLLGVRLD